MFTFNFTPYFFAFIKVYLKNFSSTVSCKHVRSLCVCVCVCVCERERERERERCWWQSRRYSLRFYQISGFRWLVDKNCALLGYWHYCLRRYSEERSFHATFFNSLAHQLTVIEKYITRNLFYCFSFPLLQMLVT